MKQKELFIIIMIVVLQTACKSTKAITELGSTKTDSTSVMNLEESIQVNEMHIAESNTALQRIMDENTNLNSETLKHEIFYAESPVDTLTGRSQIISEVLTFNSTSLDRRINVYELFLRDARIEIDALTTMNSNLELKVERMIDEQKTVKSKSVFDSVLKYILIVVGVVVIMIKL